MAKQRVYEIAKELELDKNELVKKINSLGLGFRVSNYMSMLTDAEAGAIRDVLERERDQQKEKTRLKPGVIRRRRSKPSKDADLGAEASEAGDDSSDDADTPTPEEATPHVTIRRLTQEEVAVKAQQQAEAKRQAKADAKAEAEAKRQAKAEAEARAIAEAEAEALARQEAQVRALAAAKAAAEAAKAAARRNSAPPPEAKPKPKTKPKAKTDLDRDDFDDDDDLDDIDDIDDDGPRGARRDGPSSRDSVPLSAAVPPRAAKVLGRIDPAILRARLEAEGKNFNKAAAVTSGRGAPSRGRDATPAASTEEGGDRRRDRKRRRRQINRDQLYDANARLRQSYRDRRQQKRRASKPLITQAAEHKRVIKVNEAIVISDLAHQMGVKANQIIRDLFKLGEMFTINQAVDVDTASLIADQYGYKVENVTFDMAKYYDKGAEEETAEDNVEPRPPVITIMGHVDHGKTSLLDAIRTTNIASGEAGGITQHIGAYQVELDGELITFLDTPGHEAFTALRARGAKVTDIVVLVVAADDGVMPQTVEAINHARDADVPIIVAINKIDKPGANPDRVKQALTEYNLIPEDWGGSTIFVEVSALHRTGIEELLEMINIQAEVMELSANPHQRAYGVIIESRLDIGLGATASVLVQRGTLNTGDIVVVGEHYGRVRMMFDSFGEHVDSAVPSTPVEITGLSGVPSAGEVFFVVADDKTAREIVGHIQRRKREKELAARSPKPSGLDDLTRMIQQGALQELKVIVKADVQGSVEAVVGSLGKLGNDEVKVRVIHSGAGGITENDVNLATSSSEGAVIVGFNVRPEIRAHALAEERGIQLILRSVIYEIEDLITNLLEGLLKPIIKEAVLGHAEVRETFVVPKIGTIAGCYIQDGKILRNARCRVLRENRVLYESRVATLRRFKDDVKEVKTGFECGMSVHNFNDIKIGDIIECYELEEHAATLK